MGLGSFSTSNYLAAASQTIPTLPITVSAWYFPIVSPTAAESIFSWSSSGATSRIELRLTAAAKAAASVNGSLNVAATSAAAVIAGQWNHLGGIYRISGGGPNYVAGVSLNGTYSETSPASPLYTENSADRFSCGVRTDSTYPSNPCQGYIGEVAVWNAQLTQKELEKLSTGSRAWRIRKSSLIHYYRFLSISSRWISDEVKNGNNFSITGTLTSQSNPPLRIEYGQGTLLYAPTTGPTNEQLQAIAGGNNRSPRRPSGWKRS